MFLKKKKLIIRWYEFIMFFKKTIYVKTVIFLLRLFGIVRRQSMRITGCYFAITVFVFLNINIDGDLNLNYKI